MRIEALDPAAYDDGHRGPRRARSWTPSTAAHRRQLPRRDRDRRRHRRLVGGPAPRGSRTGPSRCSSPATATASSGSTLLDRSRQPELAASRRDRQGHRAARQRADAGSAAALMQAAEERARADGRWLLILDTVTGSAAEALYRVAGLADGRRGPDYALLPDGTPWATTTSGRTCGERGAARSSSRPTRSRAR